MQQRLDFLPQQGQQQGNAQSSDRVRAACEQGGSKQQGQYLLAGCVCQPKLLLLL